jgi:hypothetical protein
MDICRIYAQDYHFLWYDRFNCEGDFMHDNSIFTIVFVIELIYNRLNHETVTKGC